MTGWVLAVVAIGAALGAILVIVGLEVTDALKKSPKSEGDAVGGLITGAVTAFFAALFTTDFDEGTGDIWPAAKTKSALGNKFKDVFAANSEAFQAVYSERMEDEPDVEGWSIAARLDRAKIIAAALQPG